ncbi:MAG: MBL fold metallo-hydrolase [Candidatus Liptonbacteria bacterium]|nr:MBL fold metallo-hydrolase [Candidatus Liptonbacteria bacterium]
MHITKFGHCCLLIEEKGLRLLTDPGGWSAGFETLTDIHVVLITHEHPDHLHTKSIKTILQKNPEAKIITNTTVRNILEKEGIATTLLEHGAHATEREVFLEAIGERHAVIHSSVPQSQNTGYFINNRLFYPGDALTNPQRPVEILALPVAGPWLTIGEATDYALALSPRACFPVHDGNLKFPGIAHNLPAKALGAKGIRFTVLEGGVPIEF